MYTNIKKSDLITELHEHRSESTCTAVLSLLDILITESRLENDTARIRKVLKNQGKIEGFVELRDHILRGLPTPTLQTGTRK
jgi:hypothetical protein